MPPRLTPLRTGYTYHIFNRTIDSKPILKSKQLAELFIERLTYYRSTKVSLSYSRFKELIDKERQQQILEEIFIKRYFQINILCYCLMPSHFHLLIQQKADGGISKYISDVLNAFTRHYNIKNKRKGPLFLPRFQANRIISREQLIHVSRYIHLNPYSSELIPDIKDLKFYRLSSYSAYIGKIHDKLCDIKSILTEFSNNKKQYEKFVLSNAEHQKTLEFTKYTKKW